MRSDNYTLCVCVCVRSGKICIHLNSPARAGWMANETNIDKTDALDFHNHPPATSTATPPMSNMCRFIFIANVVDINFSDPF